MTQDTFSPRPISRTSSILAWALQILVALAFLAAGSGKLVGAKPMVAAFAKIGVGQWFRVLTGSLEVIGAIGLLIPRTTFFAALLLIAIMVGAIIAHLTVLGGNPTAAIVLLVLSCAIAFLRRP